MITLENEYLKATINPHGAELSSLFLKSSETEFLWNGDATFWPRQSPVLFPIVGGLIDDTFIYKGKNYQLPKHGFARDVSFELGKASAERASFVLKSTEESLGYYPFEFLLRIIYTLNGSKISVEYEVENPANEILYFSIGAHPAFNVPLKKGSGYEDYYLEFEKEETTPRLILTGNIVAGSSPFFDQQKMLPLQASLFYNDALIFKNLNSTKISLKSNTSPQGLTFDFGGFPYIGIWATKDAPFVCIEPWCGIADFEGHNQKLEDKQGIIALPAGGDWKNGWSVECF
ncbi:MAG TPA: aldose 1-epimerase family protein [Pedobacter sp.]|jgi:galactose mutarotase-like enzyme